MGTKLTAETGIGGGKEKEKEKEAAIEKIVLNAQSFAFKGWPLRTLFPFIDSDEIRHLPIANLELTYSENESDNPLYQRGLRLEVDVQLRDGLQWVGESIKNLFRSYGPASHDSSQRVALGEARLVQATQAREAGSPRLLQRHVAQAVEHGRV
jgi:hypothetical protein